MDSLDKIFGYYDKLISPLSTGNQALISAALLVFLVWQVYMIFKSGHWIFITVLIVCLPGTWPAARQLLTFGWMILKLLFVRAEILIG